MSTSEGNGSRFGLVRPGQIPGMFGSPEEGRYMKKRSLTYENYMEMLSLLKSLESVVGTRQISDYMNALEVAQRNSPVDIDPANVILSMGKLYAEKSNTPFTPIQTTFSPHVPFAAARGMSNAPPVMYSRNDACRPYPVKDNSFGRLDGQISSAFREIGRLGEMKGFTKHEESETNGAPFVADKKSIPIPVQGVQQSGSINDQIVPYHMLRSQLQKVQGDPIASVEKKITNGSYLLRFNVTTDLGRLLPGHIDDSSAVHTILKDAPRSLFKRNISIIDSIGRLHCVKYEGIVSSKQRHYRLTTGWSSLVKSLKMKVGDTVIFERWTPNPAVVHMTIAPGKEEWDDFGSFENDLKRKKQEAQESPAKERDANTSPVQETSEHTVP